MSVKTQCDECGEWFAIGGKHSVGKPCYLCGIRKFQLAAEIDATYAKPKCQVFGCTIPRGIPHEHPAGVSAVMRDPGAPLTDIERAELQYHRQQAAELNDKAFQAMIEASSVPENIEWNKEVLDRYLKPMVPGRKLTQALLEAGRTHRESADVGVDYMHVPLLGDVPVSRSRSPRLVRTIGKVAFWIVLTVTVAILIFVGVKS